MDLLLCQTRSRCSECRWSGPDGCALLADLEAAAPTLRAPDRRTEPPAHAWSDAGLVFDDGGRTLA